MATVSCAGGRDIKQIFTQGPSLTARVAALILVSVVLMTIDHRQDHLSTVRSVLLTAVYPVQYVASLPESFWQWSSETLAFRSSLIEKNRRLTQQQLLLNARLQKFNILETENNRLRELLQSSFKVGERVLIAELLSVEMDPFRRQVMLNKGTQDGIYVGQPVVDAQGVMGQIIRAGPLSSVAILITDPAHALPVQINRNGLRTIATGSGSFNQLELLHLPTSADVNEGDLLVTSGLGGRFPAGYPIGVVTHVEQDPGQAFSRILVKPSAMLDQSREVLLVWPSETKLDTAQEGEEKGD